MVRPKPPLPFGAKLTSSRAEMRKGSDLSSVALSCCDGPKFTSRPSPGSDVGDLGALAFALRTGHGFKTGGEAEVAVAASAVRSVIIALK